MHRVADYRQNAQACRDLAGRMPEAQRAQLLDMAEQWERIATEREDAIRTAKSLPMESRRYGE